MVLILVRTNNKAIDNKEIMSKLFIKAEEEHLCLSRIHSKVMKIEIGELY